MADTYHSFDRQRNIIRQPGKFEGEHISIPHFWEIASDGGAQDVYDGDSVVSFIEIADRDRKEYPDLAEFGIALWEDSVGFVHSQWYATKADYLAAIADLERLEAERLAEDETREIFED